MPTSSEPTIAVEHVRKEYRLGELAGAGSFREALTGLFRGGRGKETLRALEDVSFAVQEGEAVGIIGPNGAGKSTLLKVLSRITPPTEGEGRVRGRVGSLLEVGTGFHPELTGRENVFLSGAILGMRRTEIVRKFDQIVAFAEVEAFVDTPVKHYSSGMYLRLAFAVAAHLDPEILLVDEVLAVGDARFQRKCVDRMQTVGRGGRTVVFVSHNMPTVTRLCQRALLLDAGKLVADGPAHEVASTYLQSDLGTSAEREWPERSRAPGSDVVRLRAVRVRDEQGQIAPAVDIRTRISVEMEYDVYAPGYILFPHFSVHDAQGVCAFVALDQDPEWRGRTRPPGRYRSTAWIPGNLLSEGLMLIGPAMRTLEPDIKHFYERDAACFQVIDAPGGQTARGDYGGGIPGAVRPLLTWRSETLGPADDR